MTTLSSPKANKIGLFGIQIMPMLASYLMRLRRIYGHHARLELQCLNLHSTLLLQSLAFALK